MRVPIIQQNDNFSCGEACINSILKHYTGKPLKHKLSSTVDGTNPRTIEFQLRCQGFNVVSGNFGWELLKYFIGKSVPVIICMDGHWTIVTDIFDRKVMLMNTLLDDYETLSIIKFRRSWLDYSSDGVEHKNWGIAARAFT